jgi:pimeloyl-ACP methyl ester carboxylesterase
VKFPLHSLYGIVQQERCDIAGHSLETLLLPGSAASPPIVLLHEGLGSVGLWRDLPQQLHARTGCTIFAYSRYGNGFSATLEAPRRPQYMHDEAARALPELLDRMAFDRVTLVGHSDGASIAAIYAGIEPSRVAALVLAAPHVFVEDLSVQSIAAIRQSYTATPLRERLAKYHADVDRTFYGWNDIWLDPAFRDWNIEAYLPAITAPVLLLQGRDDEYGTLAQLDAVERGCPAGVERVVLEGCGHNPFRDRPAAATALCARVAQAAKK